MRKPFISFPICVKFSWFFLIQILSSPHSVEASAPVTAKNILALLELDQDQTAKLEQGKIIAFEIKERSPKELSMGLAMLLPSPPVKLVDFFRRGDLATIDPDVSALGEIPPQSGIDAFKGFAFSQNHYHEVHNLLNASATDRFNLSVEEISKFVSLRKQVADIDKASQITHVSQHYQQMLWQRWDAYRKQGLAGIAPYARSGTESSPAEELHLAAADSQWLTLFSPALKQAWLSYPSQLPEGAEEHFFGSTGKSMIDPQRYLIIASCLHPMTTQ